MSLKIVRKAIEIQGYIMVSVAGRGMKCRKIDVIDGEWTTDIATVDLCGRVRIKKTKHAIIEQARWIVANEEAIRAERSDRARAAAALATD